MVIQRWQSVLLVCAAVMMACFTFFSIGQVQAPEFTLDFTTLGFEYEGEAVKGGFSGSYLNTWYFFTISLMAALIPLINVFLYRNLNLQKRVCLIEVVFIMAIYATGYTLGHTAIPEGSVIGWSSVCGAPLIALAADIMAWRRIEADRQKLLAADRIR